jgi:hypothetical protein
MQCEKIIGGGREPLVRCEEEGTRKVIYPSGVSKQFCPYHHRFELAGGDDRWGRHREFVNSLPMSGYEAMRDLQREIGQ